MDGLVEIDKNANVWWVVGGVGACGLSGTVLCHLHDTT
jgi:hypothetical protein